MRLYQTGARVDTIEHCSFAGPDRKYGSDFDPAVVEDIAAAGHLRMSDHERARADDA